jgi:hypothetical protein
MRIYVRSIEHPYSVADPGYLPGFFVATNIVKL